MNTNSYLLTVEQFCQENKFISQGGLRYQIFHSDRNGLKDHGAIVRMGRRVLINKEKYFTWIESQQK